MKKDMDAPKSKNFIWIVLAGIVASVLIGMLAKILEWSFLEETLASSVPVHG